MRVGSKVSFCFLEINEGSNSFSTPFSFDEEQYKTNIRIYSNREHSLIGKLSPLLRQGCESKGDFIPLFLGPKGEV